MRMQLEEAQQRLRLRAQPTQPEECSPSPGPNQATPDALPEADSGEQEETQGATEEGPREGEELGSKAAPESSGVVSQGTQTEADEAPDSAEESGKEASECLELALLSGPGAEASEPPKRENAQTGIEKEAEMQKCKEEEEAEEGEDERGEKEQTQGGLLAVQDRGSLTSEDPRRLPSGNAVAPHPMEQDVEKRSSLHQEAVEAAEDREALIPSDADGKDDALEELDVSDERLQQWLRAVADTMASMREESASEATSSQEEGSRMFFLTAEAAYGHLGFRLTAPPGHFVYRCEEGSWADQVGLQQGDQLVQLQGMDVGLLPHALLRLALERHRPLELTFARGFGVGSLVEDIAGSLSGLRARSQTPADAQEATAATPCRRTEDSLEDPAHPPSVEDDRALALAAVQKNCDAFPLLSVPMRYDREITLEAVRQKGGLLQYTSPVLQADREVVGAAVQQSGAALRFAAPARRNELGLVRRAVTRTPEIFPFLPAEQKARRELASVAVARDGMLLSAVPTLQDDKDIVLAAVRQNPAALQFASSSL